MKKHLFYVVFIITAVFVAAGGAFADCPGPRDSVPTLTEWGMIGAALVFGLASTYKILKKKK